MPQKVRLSKEIGVRYCITLERANAMLRKNMEYECNSVAHTIVENPPNHEKNREPNYFRQMTEERTVNQILDFSTKSKKHQK